MPLNSNSAPPQPPPDRLTEPVFVTEGMSRDQILFVSGFALGMVTSVIGAWLLLKLLS